MRQQILVEVQSVRSCENPSSGSHSDTREQRQTGGLDDSNSRFINTPKTANPHKTKIPNNCCTELTSAILIQTCTGKLMF